MENQKKQALKTTNIQLSIPNILTNDKAITITSHVTRTRSAYLEDKIVSRLVPSVHHQN